MCQKFVSGDKNSTPIYCLPSRARWMDTTRHSIDCAVWSFIRISVCPTNTISSSGNKAPCRFTDCELVCAQNFSPESVFPRTVKGTVKATRSVRRRSLHRKWSRDISNRDLNSGFLLLLAFDYFRALSLAMLFRVNRVPKRKNNRIELSSTNLAHTALSLLSGLFSRNG
jgi:hypothetical protein